MTFFRYALLLGAFAAIFGGAARASFIVYPYSPPFNGTTNLNDITLTLAATVPFPTSSSQIGAEDLRGTAAVADTATSGFVYLTSGTSAPLGNTLFLGTSSDLSQQIALSFDLMPSDLNFQSPFFTEEVQALAIGIASGTVTDPSLTPFLGTSVFGFSYQANLSDPAKGQLVYGLNFFTPLTLAPEPSTTMLVGSGFFLVGLTAMRRRRS